jgi:hypothetical protein
MDASRRRRILGLALPILGGMVSQNLLNVVDTAMVGFLGNPALAAVGLGGFVVFMCQALILGIYGAAAGSRGGAGILSRTYPACGALISFPEQGQRSYSAGCPLPGTATGRDRIRWHELRLSRLLECS